ncbi:hypothetical protein LTR85_001218 [Meristemomyces frigidus]|nr:hypothetical protein LTR85_001218 [Meristemomyces frigidus]
MTKRKASDSLEGRVLKAQRQRMSAEAQRETEVKDPLRDADSAQARLAVNGIELGKEGTPKDGADGASDPSDKTTGSEKKTTAEEKLSNGRNAVDLERVATRDRHRQPHGAEPAIDTHNSSTRGPLPQNPAKDLSTSGAPLSRKLLHLLVAACEHRRTISGKTRESATLEVRLKQAQNDMDLRNKFDRLRATIDTLGLWQKERVRNLARIVDPSMAGDPNLDMMPVKWFSHPSSLQQHQRTITKLQLEIAQLDETLALLGGQQSGLYAKRTDILLETKDEDEREQAAREVDSDLERLETSFGAVSDDRVRLHCELALALTREAIVSDLTMEMADEALVDAGLMAPSDEPQEDDGHEERAKAERIALEKPSTPSRRDRRTDRRESLPRKALTETRREDRSFRTADADARRAWSEASRDFRRTREDYGGNLADFLRRKEEGKVIGTKTHFDAGFFIARNNSNNKLTLAQNQYERAKKAAQRVGVLPAHEQTSDFADQPEDGYTPTEIHAYVQTLDRDGIDIWRRAVAQEDVELDERKWEVEGVDRHESSKSVAAESSCSQDRYDTGRLKKLIARWKGQQEELRAESEADREADVTSR